MRSFSRFSCCRLAASSIRRARAVKLPPPAERLKRESLCPGSVSPATTDARCTIQSRGELTRSLLIVLCEGIARAPIADCFEVVGLRSRDVLWPTSC